MDSAERISFATDFAEIEVSDRKVRRDMSSAVGVTNAIINLITLSTVAFVVTAGSLSGRGAIILSRSVDVKAAWAGRFACIGFVALTCLGLAGESFTESTGLKVLIGGSLAVLPYLSATRPAWGRAVGYGALASVGVFSTLALVKLAVEKYFDWRGKRNNKFLLEKTVAYVMKRLDERPIQGRAIQAELDGLSCRNSLSIAQDKFLVTINDQTKGLFKKLLEKKMPVRDLFDSKDSVTFAVLLDYLESDSRDEAYITRLKPNERFHNNDNDRASFFSRQADEINGKLVIYPPVEVGEVTRHRIYAINQQLTSISIALAPREAAGSGK